MSDEGIFMTVAEDPRGPWSEPVNIRKETGWIDPCPFWDEDGRAYLVAGVAKSRIGYNSVLYISEMRPDGMGLIGEPVMIFDGKQCGQRIIEGPKLYKKDGWYYIFAPAGGVKTGWQTALRSKNIWGPYEYRVVMCQGQSPVNGPHQGAWVDTVTGEDWFLHFQDVYGAGRIVHLQPMHFEQDWPVIGVKRDGQDYGEPVMEYRKPDVGDVMWTVCQPPASDDFAGKELGLQWQWNANYKKDWYRLTGDRLLLRAVRKDSAYGDIPNLLLQKWPAPEFTCVTSLDLSALTDGDETGVVSMGVEYGVVSFLKVGESLQIRFIRGSQRYGKILVEETAEQVEKLEEIPADCGKQITVYYIVKRDGVQDLNQVEKGFPKELVTFSYGIGDEETRLAGQMTAVPGRWVGVKHGVFCVSDHENSSGEAAVKSVQYHFF